jgi:hypothetical protein
MATVCAVAGISDASLELEPLLQSTGRGSRDSDGERESGKVTESDREGATHACARWDPQAGWQGQRRTARRWSPK